MKKIYLSIVFISFSLMAIAQISIGTGDMPTANDSIRMSSALNTQLYNFAQTDTNYNWDFSQLTAKSQRSELYMSVSSTPIIYNIVFFSKSNLASRRDDMNILNINITNGYNFFKNSNSDFRQVGYGANVNGSQIPVSFKSDDIVYRFPIAYGNVDSSDSEWEVNIPNLAFINEKIHRVNTVDGWGTISTPYGTFQCIRLKSKVLQEDTIHYTSTGIGMRLPQTYTEYIWLSKTIPFPILKVKSSIGGGLTTIEYADSARQFVGIETAETENMNVKVFPNPSTSGFTISVQSQSKNNQLQIMDLSGRVVYEDHITSNFTHNYPKDMFAKGVYILRINSDKSTITKKIVIQ